MEDGLAAFDKRLELLDVVELHSLLVDGPLHAGQHVRHDVACVFQADAEAAGAGFVREKMDVVDGMVLGEFETVFVVPAVNVVWVHAVEALYSMG